MVVDLDKAANIDRFTTLKFFYERCMKFSNSRDLQSVTTMAEIDFANFSEGDMNLSDVKLPEAKRRKKNAAAEAYAMAWSNEN